MDANETPILANDDFPATRAATHAIIGAAFKVHGKLRHGFNEKVYENALILELRKAGLDVEQQAPIQVRYDEEVVGTFVCDLLVERCVIVELKACIALNRDHHNQCINYLRATGLNVCLLLNFGRSSLEYKRIAMTHPLARIGVPLAEIGVP